MERDRIKIVEQEDPVLTSFPKHTKTTATYRATISENNLKTSRRDFPQLRIKRDHDKKGRGSGDGV